MAAPSQSLSASVLNSWKEIAAYIGRGVRTVQRYERELNLPVRRPSGAPRSAVIALKEDLDEWLRKAPLDESRRLPVIDGWPAGKLVTADPALREQCRALRAAHNEAMAKLLSSVNRLAEQISEVRSRVQSMRGNGYGRLQRGLDERKSSLSPRR